MHIFRNVVLATLCLWAIWSLVQHSDKYSLTVRVAMILAFTAVGIVLLVDLVWPIRALVSIAAAGLCLAYETVLVLSPTADWPQSYVSTLKVGLAMAFLALCVSAGFRMGLLPHALFLAGGVVGLLGVVLLVVALVVLRPRGRPYNGVC
ncbi:MAG: hypothetical protein M1133_04700 [Armatimonadetes bacterium]|nr:hypothetical protein [Armatimonadota bacterium]